MSARDPVSERVITRNVSQQPQNRGMRPSCQVAVMSQKGTVTLSGKIQYEHQRRIALHTARGVDGLQRVIDRLQVIAKEMHWK